MGKNRTVADPVATLDERDQVCFSCRLPRCAPSSTQCAWRNWSHEGLALAQRQAQMEKKSHERT